MNRGKSCRHEILRSPEIYEKVLMKIVVRNARPRFFFYSVENFLTTINFVDENVLHRHAYGPELGSLVTREMAEQNRY